MQSCLESIPDDIERLFVAYSGGVDSTVLLHLAARDPHRQVIAWHVNHGLLDSAGQMMDFCTEQAEKFGLKLRVDCIDLSGVDSNLEAQARRMRYQLFAEHTRAGDCLLTAHHADDQAETFLLNALRGSGSAGLRGIARRRMLGDTLLMRPLLDYSRAELEAYANRHELAWFNDPSNRDLRFDRNYVRNEIVPLLKTRWPTAGESLAGAARLQSEVQEVLDEIAADDLARLQRPDSGFGATLDLCGLLELSTGRRKNLLRFWIAAADYPGLPQARLQELLNQLQSRADASPEIAMPGYSIRIYDQRLFLVPRRSDPACSGVFDFDVQDEIEIAQFDLHWRRADVFERLGLEDRKQSLSLKFRASGEENDDRRRLKRLFQQHRVPPWRRDTTPQIYLDGRLEGLLL